MPDAPKQIRELSELAGKTIARTVNDPDAEYDYLGLVFTDGSFLRLAIDEGYGDNSSITWDGEPSGWEQRRAFGLMSEDEYNAKKAKADRFDAERRRLDYERLKAEFDIGHPDECAALEVAKAALSNRDAWTGEKLPVPATEAEIALRELVNHPLLLDLFGNLEDNSSKESTRLFGYVKVWVELRDATLATLSPTEAAPDA